MAQKNKCTITEERLTRLVSESIEEVLLEAQNDEGLGGWLGKMAGKIRNGVNKFRDDFNAQRNGQLYQNRNYDAYSANEIDPNARNFNKTMSQNYRSAAQRGASNAAPGSFKTSYGDSVGNRGNNDVLQQMQQTLTSLTQQMQSLIQNGGGQSSTGGAQDSTGGAQGSTGGAQGSTGGAQGSTEGTQGSTGGAQGSTGGAQGSTGGAQGGTGGSQDSQYIIDRQRTTQNAKKRRELSPDEYKTNDGKTSTAAQNDAELHKGTNPDNPYADLEESRKRQLSGKTLMEIIAKTIKKHLNESLNEISPEKMAAVAHGRKQQAQGQRPLSPAMQRRGMTQQDMGNLERGDRLQAVDAWNQQYGTNKDPNTFGGRHRKMNSDYTVDDTWYDQDTETPDGQFNTKGFRYDPTDDTQQDFRSTYTTDTTGKEMRPNARGIDKFGGTITNADGSSVTQTPSLDSRGNTTGMRVNTKDKKTARTHDQDGYSAARRMANPGTK